MLRRLGTIGAVSLLVLTLTAFGQAPLTVTGTATYRERMALPSGAVFEATLEDVSRADASAQAIGTTRVENPGNPPFHFSIAYEPEKIITSHTYAVRARITENGRLLFTSTQRYQVLTQGHGSEISMMLLQQVSSTSAHAAQTAAPGDEPLRETYWKLIELNGKPVATADRQQEAHLVFRTEDKRVSGSGGCNRLMGGYTVEGNTMHFSGVASTMMACLHGMDTEQAFVVALNRVKTWKIAGKHLEMYGKRGRTLAKFEATALK
ncbi:MAG: YbaY family lipoprotein [Acidobacteria bacterium]|nr:YbaY family lipoprotein [Acidobacteriota bacterium]